MAFEMSERLAKGGIDFGSARGCREKKPYTETEQVKESFMAEDLMGMFGRKLSI